MLRKFAVAMVIASSFSLPAAAQDPVAETCEFADILDKGTDVTIGQLLKLARLWPDADRAKLDPIFRPELKGFNMSKGKVYQIADLGEFAQEFLVVTTDRSRASNIYFRIIFQTYDEGYFFKNVKFNSDYYKITSPAFIQEPEPVDCG
ncbi:MAG: hypothetical protein AB3N20_19235 [Rhizobiaceae bacterium]